MTTKPKDDGGPAFPWDQSPGNQDNLGLSKRDWFAGMAMQGHISAIVDADDWDNELPDWIAGWAYRFADAMLAERDKA